MHVKGDDVHSIGPITVKSETEQTVRAPYATCEEQTMMHVAEGGSRPGNQ